MMAQHSVSMPTCVLPTGCSVGYLVGELVLILQRKQPELEITCTLCQDSRIVPRPWSVWTVPELLVLDTCAHI